MCAGTHVDMCVDMCMYMCAGVCADMCGEMCAGMCVDDLDGASRVESKPLLDAAVQVILILPCA